MDEVKKYEVYPLAQASNPPQLNFINMSGKPFDMVEYGRMNILGNAQSGRAGRPDTVDPTTLGMWASIGIQEKANRSPLTST